MAERVRSPSGLSDEQWELVEPALGRNATWDRPRRVALREVVNALVSLMRTGCPWDDLPHVFPHRSTVRSNFDKWWEDGTWAHLTDRLRRQVRIETGRDLEPRAAVADRRSVKTTEAGRSASMMGKGSWAQAPGAR